jgi:hypothetical protein
MRRLLPLCLALAGCGSSTHVSPPADMGPTLRMGPPATQLVSEAVTLLYTDDTRVFYATIDGRVDEVPLAGGTPHTIAAHSDSTMVKDADHVASWQVTYAPPPGVNNGWQSGILSVWRRDLGTIVLGQHSVPYSAALSDDGSLAAYQDNMTPDGKFADIFIARTDGSTAPRLLLGQVATGALLKFAGARLVMLHGPSGNTFASWDLSLADAAGNITALDSGVTGSQPFAFSSDKTRVIGFQPFLHKLRSYALDGSATVDLDKPGNMVQNGGRGNQPVANAVGGDIIYFADMDVRRVSVTGGPITDLAQTLASALVGISPDGSRVAWANTSPGTDQPGALTVTSSDGHDLTSISDAGLNQEASLSFDLSEPFTPDGNTLLYFAFGLQACDIASGTSTMLSRASVHAAPVSASQVVSSDSRVTSPADAAQPKTAIDVVLYDVHGAVTPMRLARDVDYGWLLTPHRTRLVFTVSHGTSVGLFVTTLPAR